MTGISIGYARVSTTDQSLDIQTQQLTDTGCSRIFSEKMSGKTVAGREELDRCLAFVREGDTLVVTRLDRLGRSVRDLLDIVERLSSRGIKFRCLSQPLFDINESTSKLFFTMLAGFAEFELNVRKERQAEGVARAKARGVYKGGKPKYSPIKTQNAARKLAKDHHWGATAIARHLNMSLRTLYRLCEDAQPPIFGKLPPELAASMEKMDVSADPPTNP